MSDEREARKPWFLGSCNDGLFIVNRKPTPCGTDLAVGTPNPDPATVVLNVTDLPDAKAQAIVDAHNAAIKGLSPGPGEAGAAYAAFFDKYALGPKLAPSCLRCGRSTQGRELGIQHIELPGIVICAECCAAPAVDEAAASAMREVSELVTEWWTSGMDNVEFFNRIVRVPGFDCTKLTAALGA